MVDVVAAEEAEPNTLDIASLTISQQLLDVVCFYYPGLTRITTKRAQLEYDRFRNIAVNLEAIYHLDELSLKVDNLNLGHFEKAALRFNLGEVRTGSQ